MGSPRRGPPLFLLPAVALCAGAAGYMLQTLWQVPIQPPWVAAGALGSAAVAYFWRRSPAYFWSSAAFAAMSAIWSYYREPPFRAATRRVLGGFADLARQIVGGEVERVDPAAGAVLLAGFGCGLAVLLVAAFPNRVRILRSLLLGFSPFPVAWLFFVDQASGWGAAYLACGLLFLAAGELEARGVRAAAAAPHVAGLLAGALLFAQVLPDGFEVVALESVARTALRAWPQLGRLRGGAAAGPAARAQFSLSLSGYAPGGEAELGGPILPGDGVALRVEARGALPADALYLRARSLAVYTGRGWLEDPGGWQPVAAAVALPYGYPSAVPWDGLELVARLVGFRTASLFAPWQPERVELPGRNDLAAPTTADGGVWQRPDGALATARALQPGEGYRVRSRRPRIGAAHVRALSAPRGLTDEERRTLGPYLELPPSVPERVRALARRVAGEAASDHPWDRARAIEDYLRRIPYRLDVEAPPPGRDFADYFLFDLRAGYCTYHSTAMVVLLREVGIPARWVEGFRVPLPPDAGRSPAGDRGARLDVRNRDAHAWAEAYFPGYGWVPFEPTAAFPLPDRSHAPAPDVPEDASSPADFPANAGPRPRPADDLLAELDAGDLGEARAAAPWQRWLARTAWALLAACGLIGAAAALLVHREERIPADAVAAVRAAYRNAARVHELLPPAAASEAPRGLTPAERMAAAARAWPALAPALARLVDAYYQVRYGRGRPGEEQVSAAIGAWRALASAARKTAGRWRFHAARLRRGLRHGIARALSTGAPRDG